MDPDAALTNAREALARLRGAQDADLADETSEHAEELADAFEALDGWLSKGGFLPAPWSGGS